MGKSLDMISEKKNMAYYAIKKSAAIEQKNVINIFKARRRYKMDYVLHKHDR